jgi:hypothetical protein
VDSISLSSGTRTSRNSALKGRSSTYQFGPRPDHRQVDLRLHAAMPHWPQQLAIDSRPPRQGLRIVPIIFPTALGDQLHLVSNIAPSTP